MRFTACSAYMIAFLLVWPANAQQRTTQPAAPALLDCGVHGDIEILCGTHSPEDLELTPDGKYLTATQFINQGRGGAGGGGMELFDLAKKTFARMVETAEPDKILGRSGLPRPDCGCAVVAWLFARQTVERRLGALCCESRRA
jgi:hypothetical protein